MRYFRLNLGDYEAATSHLSLLEDAIYMRLLRVYYRDEKPLPADMNKLCRLARASTPPLRDALAAVLSEYFTADPSTGEWHNRRADREIQSYQGVRDANRIAAAQRWHSERIADAMPPQEPRSNNQERAPLTPQKARRSKARKSVDGETLTGDRESFALASLPDLDAAAEWDRFESYHRAKGSTMADWSAAWRTWISNAARGGMSYARSRAAVQPLSVELTAEAKAAQAARERYVSGTGPVVAKDPDWWEDADAR